MLEYHSRLCIKGVLLFGQDTRGSRRPNFTEKRSILYYGRHMQLYRPLKPGTDLWPYGQQDRNINLKHGVNLDPGDFDGGQDVDLKRIPVSTRHILQKFNCPNNITLTI